MCDIPVVAHLILYKSGVPHSLWFFPLPGKSATVENERDRSMCSTECLYADIQKCASEFPDLSEE
jgi:hypothetical protein